MKNKIDTNQTEVDNLVHKYRVNRIQEAIDADLISETDIKAYLLEKGKEIIETKRLRELIKLYSLTTQTD